nr:hypothetical protein Iba_chr11eCG14190 [Ipomoea batatas]
MEAGLVFTKRPTKECANDNIRTATLLQTSSLGKHWTPTGMGDHVDFRAATLLALLLHLRFQLFNPLPQFTSPALVLDPPVANRNHIVDGEQHDDEDGYDDILNDDRVAAAFDSVNAQYHQLAKRSFED